MLADVSDRVCQIWTSHSYSESLNSVQHADQKVNQIETYCFNIIFNIPYPKKYLVTSLHRLDQPGITKVTKQQIYHKTCKTVFN